GATEESRVDFLGARAQVALDSRLGVGLRGLCGQWGGEEKTGEKRMQSHLQRLPRRMGKGSFLVVVCLCGCRWRLGRSRSPQTRSGRQTAPAARLRVRQW